MIKTRFNGPVYFSYVIAKDLISLNGSRFAEELDFNAINIRTGLFINAALFDKKVNLISSQIGGQVSMQGCTSKQELDMDRMKVVDNLFMDGYELKKDGQVVEVRPALFKGVVRLLGAEIGGQVVMSGSTFTQELNMEMAQASDLFFTDITMSEGANFYCLSVKNNLILGLFKSGENEQKKIKIDLSNATIGNFAMGFTSESDDFRKRGELILSHTKVGVLMAAENSWPTEPGHVDLTGFTYERIKDPTVKNIGEIGWFDRMLKSQEHFTPQPYEQLAKVLMAEGYRERAEDILYKKRVLER